MKRALWTPALAALILAAAGGTFLVRGGSADKKELPPAAEAPKPAAEAAKPAAPTTPADAPKPGPGYPAEPGRRAKAADERNQLLETVGCLTAAHYFQTYLNIGFIADGKTRGTYTDRDARKVLDSVLSLLNSTERKLEALDKIELDRGDRARLEELRAVSALLRQQGKELQAYWDSGKDENAARYETLRQNAWATIAKLMGIGPLARE
jgi:hypothetical protein